MSKTSSPHATLYENQDATKLYRWAVGIAFVFILISYIVLCDYTAYYVKRFLIAIKFDFWWAYSCDDIDGMFENDQESYKQWAEYDSQFRMHGQMTGIYECYCVTKVTTATFFKVWTDPEADICTDYAAMGMGGTMMTMPSGAVNGILSNLGAVLVAKFVPLIRFKSQHTERHTVVISIFIISYVNMGLLILRAYTDQTYIPKPFQIQWLLFWGKAISMSLLISNLMPLAGPSIKALIKRGFCCCKRQVYKPNRHLNPNFAIERRYAGIINTCWLVFTYSYSIPILPLVGSFVLMIQYVVDKILITYFYKEVVEHNDLLNRTALRLIKWGIVLYYAFGAYSMASNYCTIYNGKNFELEYVTEFLTCFKMYSSCWIMVGFGLFYTASIVSISTFKTTKRDDIKFYDSLENIEKNYFARLTNSDRKKWIALEHYRRTHFGIRMLKDNVLEKLISTSGRTYHTTNDPPNYDILVNQKYINSFQYQHPVLTQLDKKQYLVSDQVIRAVYGQYMTKKFAPGQSRAALLSQDSLEEESDSDEDVAFDKGTTIQ